MLDFAATSWIMTSPETLRSMCTAWGELAEPGKLWWNQSQGVVNQVWNSAASTVQVRGEGDWDVDCVYVWVGGGGACVGVVAYMCLCVCMCCMCCVWSYTCVCVLCVCWCGCAHCVCGCVGVCSDVVGGWVWNSWVLMYAFMVLFLFCLFWLSSWCR